VAADKIRIGDPKNLPTAVDAYPQVILNLEAKQEEIAEINMSSGRRTMKLNLAVYCFSYIASNSDNSDKTMHILTRNVENVLRANFKQSPTYWDSANILSGQFEGGYTEPSKKDTYLSSAKINMEITHLFS